MNYNVVSAAEITYIHDNVIWDAGFGAHTPARGTTEYR